LAGFEPATFGSSGKHTNHYTTKATVGISLGEKKCNYSFDRFLAISELRCLYVDVVSIVVIVMFHKMEKISVDLVLPEKEIIK
jgi:hypothetical protein